MALLTPEQDTALAGLSGGLLGLSQALLKAGQGGVPFQRTGLLSGIGQGFAGFGQGAEEARKLALQEQTQATQQGLLSQKLSDQKRQQAALDTALATMPEDQRAAFSVLSPDDAGKLLADRAQRNADWQELQPVLGAMGLSVPGGAAPAAASAATAPASATLPATLPVGRTSYAMTPENLRRQAGFESGGNAAARNPRSSALGTQQFIDSTWQQFIQENPEVFQGMSREQAMSMRSDPRYADLGAQWYAQKGGEVLQQAGLPVTQSNLALHHRFGPGDAPKVIAADPATPMEQLVSPAVISANPDLQGKTAGQVRGTYAMRYGNAGAPAGAPAATTSPATQGAPVDRNLIFGLSVAAAKGNKAAATLLPVIQGLTKQEADAVVVSPGGALVDKRTGRVVYQAPEKPAAAPAGYRWSDNGGLEAIPGGPAASNGRPFQGNALDAQAMNILLKGDPSTPEYAAAYSQVGQGRVLADGSTQRPNMTAYRTPTYRPPTAAPITPQSAQQDDPMARPPSPAPTAADYTTPITTPATNPTQTQNTTALYARRIQEALPVIESHAGELTNRWQSTLSGVPMVGNSLISNGRQQAEQAQRDFINAVLRRESGAAIAESEFDSARKQYFPQPGDSADTLAQKKKNRELVLRSLIQEAGPAWTEQDRGEGQPKSSGDQNQKKLRFNLQTGEWE